MILGGLVRGYLTRRLMRTEKVKELITIIKVKKIKEGGRERERDVCLTIISCRMLKLS